MSEELVYNPLGLYRAFLCLEEVDCTVSWPLWNSVEAKRSLLGKSKRCSHVYAAGQHGR